MNGSSWLVMSQGPQPGQSFMLDRDWLTLGRDPSNDIEINDPQISRQHARITRQGRMMVIEDLGSTNGTFVNGMRLTGSHVMANGDMIGLTRCYPTTFGNIMDKPFLEVWNGWEMRQFRSSIVKETWLDEVEHFSWIVGTGSWPEYPELRCRFARPNARSELRRLLWYRYLL